MATIAMDPEEIRSNALQYDTCANEISDMLAKLQGIQDQLAGAWSGQAFQAFDQQFEQMKPTVTNFGELLSNVASQMRSVAQGLESTDQDIASKISGS